MRIDSMYPAINIDRDDLHNRTDTARNDRTGID
jgi:hypothetical protein